MHFTVQHGRVSFVMFKEFPNNYNKKKSIFEILGSRGGWYDDDCLLVCCAI
jgi:hypothetical protein